MTFGCNHTVGPIVLAAIMALPAAPLAAATKLKEETFFTKLPADTVAVTRGSRIGGKGTPATIQPFDDPAIDTGFADLQKIRNKAGEVVGFGIQLEVWATNDAGKLKTEFPTSWTIVLPGRGTLFLHQIENAGVLFDKVKAARSGPQPWHGAIDERTTIGPGPGGVGIIIGGTGEFEGQRGTFIESNQFTDMDARGGTGDGATSALVGVVGSTTIALSYSD